MVEQSQDKQVPDARRHPRFKLEVDVTIRSDLFGAIPCMSIEMSESGMSAILPVELPVGELVDLHINLPLGPVDQRAVVRNKNALRHGFEFTDHKRSRATARSRHG